MNRRADAGHRLQQAHAAFAGGDIATAFAIAGQVLSHIPSANEARVLRLNAAVKLERWQDAIADLDMLIAAHPQQAKLHKTLALCWLRVGNAYKAQGNFDAAVDAYRKAIGADAGCHDARFNLGVLLLEHQRPHEAVVLLRHMLERTPADVAAALKLAEAQIATGDNAAAIELLGRIAHEHDRATLQQVSKLLLQAGSGDAAKSLACRVIKEQSGVEAWAREFCRQLRNYSDLDGSRELLSLLRRHTGDAIECLRIDMADALGLPSTYPDAATLQSTRQHFIGRLGQFTSDYPPARIAALAPPAETLLWDNFYLAYQGENDRDPQRRFGEWLSASLSALTARATATANTRARSQHKLPRLAMVSSRFHECTVGAYFSSWVEHLAGAGWEVILTHVGGYRDHVTERLATKAHGELTLTGNIVENAQKLGELDANLILYPELGMDYRTSALAAQRLAGVQVCAWGHPVTTGLPTIDAFLSCAEMEPTDAGNHYSERLLTLPGLGTRYLSPAKTSASSRAALGLPDEGNLYLVPQSMFKLHPDNDRVFTEIARRDGGAVLVLFTGIEEGARLAFHERLSLAFKREGLIPERHLLFLPMRSRADYLRVNLACDVMLDSLHWSGGNTSLDALHCGLPVITSPGRFMRGRQSMAMLQRLDCAELIAESPQQLAELAIDIAHDRTRRNAIVSRINANLPALVQSNEPLYVLDVILRGLLAEL